MVALANSFVDGVLSILELQVDRVEVKEELCVDGRCFSELEQRVLELEAQLQELSTQATVVETEPEPESTSEVEIPATEDSTTGVDGADLVVESVSGEEGVEIVPEIPAAETVETEALSDGQTTEDSTTVIVEEETAWLRTRWRRCLSQLSLKRRSQYLKRGSRNSRSQIRLRLYQSQSQRQQRLRWLLMMGCSKVSKKFLLMLVRG
jgi:hypothetical protein